MDLPSLTKTITFPPCSIPSPVSAEKLGCSNHAGINYSDEWGLAPGYLLREESEMNHGEWFILSMYTGH